MKKIPHKQITTSNLGQIVLQQKAVKKRSLTAQQQAFTQATKASWQLYKGLSPMLRHISTKGLAAHFAQQFIALLKNKPYSIAAGLQSSPGRKLFQSLDCNKNALLKNVLSGYYTLEKASGKIELPGFEPKEQLIYPPSTAYVCLQAGVLSIDFDKPGSFGLGRSRALYIPMDAAAQKVCLPLLTFPDSQGCCFYLLKILFLDSVAYNDLLTNSYQQSIHPSFNVLSVIDLG